MGKPSSKDREFCDRELEDRLQKIIEMDEFHRCHQVLKQGESLKIKSYLISY